MRQRGFRLVLKKLVDRTVGIAGLAASAPLIGAVAVAVRASMGSPVVFRQVRPGLHGKPFTIMKFRTMSNGRDREGNLLPDTERLTRVGRFLRATSLDELPQLWNVAKGELSLVGPRPLLMEYLPLYSSQQARRHDVLPGITGLAQIRGRNALGWDEKFRYDVEYVDNWSLGLDAKILFETARKVLARDGISAEGHVTMPKFRGTGDGR
ncbi:Lipid carrier : UDP-N-acetylgalactosaminyltransferase [Labilithrix luteola]|uniref:Lipid carrier: UDP-N-acetylgalactosaminyltransferase n=1 Tax=Labilithrix luteola TaxID=1391654 RepID=A0A0K1Q5Q4_9BACT|nr:sugar transferase [Labilithrix luteola]AKV01161.1 Lipid carrier : UDP-N-acetylgalactosaminyltransferase [Labilithrix luteola]